MTSPKTPSPTGEQVFNYMNQSGHFFKKKKTTLQEVNKRYLSVYNTVSWSSLKKIKYNLQIWTYSSTI